MNFCLLSILVTETEKIIYFDKKQTSICKDICKTLRLQFSAKIGKPYYRDLLWSCPFNYKEVKHPKLRLQ